jgi:outer membrane protein OmpA-like peptidoglycan-associated protein
METTMISPTQFACLVFLGALASGCAAPGGTGTQPQGADVAYDAGGSRKQKPISVKQTDRGVLISADERVFFETGKSDIKKEGREALIKIAELLKTRTSAPASIEGHTDNVGTAPANLQLSQRRADAVRDALVANGVVAARMKTQGFGASKPIGTNDTADGRQANRRTDILVIGEKEQNLTRVGEPDLGDRLSAGIEKFVQDAGNYLKSVFGGDK